MPCTIGKNSRWQHLKADRYTGFDYQKVPDCPGVYVIYFNSGLSYVGSSKNLRHRLYKHQIIPRGIAVGTSWGDMKVRTIRIKWRTTRRHGEWLMVEAQLIRRLQPPLNIHGLR